MKIDTEMNGHGIQSLEIGIDILKKIGEANKPLSITEISNLCQIPKSKLHRYLTSFCRTGFLQRDSSLLYTIGTNLIMIGMNAASQSFHIKELAKPTLLRLRDSLNETVFLTIWGGNGPYPIVLEKSQRPINIGIQVGYQTSMILTTSGRLFAAFLPEKLTKNILQKEMAELQVDPEEFQKEIAKIRKNKYAITKESLIPGIVAVGCPVFDRNDKIVATISVVGILGVLDLSCDSAVISLLKKECEELSRSLPF